MFKYNKSFNQSGFTMIEILVATTMAAVAVAFAFSAANSIQKKSNARKAASVFRDDLRLAIAQSKGESTTVVFCALNRGNPNLCDTSDEQVDDFKYGWQWFVDEDGSCDAMQRITNGNETRADVILGRNFTTINDGISIVIEPANGIPLRLENCTNGIGDMATERKGIKLYFTNGKRVPENARAPTVGQDIGIPYDTMFTIRDDLNERVASAPYAEKGRAISRVTLDGETGQTTLQQELD